MAAVRNITPTPPPGLAHTPSTPRFGYSDNYEPYSPRRKSARVQERAQVSQTPRKAATYKDIMSSSPPPTSPQTASKRVPKRFTNAESSRRISGALTHDATASAATALGLPSQNPSPQPKADARRSTTLMRNTGMLPTPDKTPKKRPNGPTPSITAIARTLFTSRSETIDEAMPSPKKGRKKYSGFTLDSFGAEDQDSIQIYTDSHDRIPEVDTSADNPFHGAGVVSQPEPIKRTSKRRKVVVPGEGEQSIEDINNRDDGMLVVFRGKKFFRKHVPQHDDDNDSLNGSDTEVAPELDADISPRLRRSLNRSAIKPRLLFPSARQEAAKASRSQQTEDEEEAVTDIEEEPSTPADFEMNKLIATPKAPRFAPASPPTTVRATRSKDVRVIDSDDDTRRTRSDVTTSPFAGWQRTKGSGGAQKRAGSPMANKSKKLRG